ncbi:MAG: acylneuraminate cytidylyltransferase family protein [Muribaculaceae bacterium]|nr:acylneuraminate cytidylyltransferase family protein [Muribaculaceae bacterium]
MHRPLIIIPARGGSKGIPRKNIRLLDGKPLIAYTIEVAKAVAGDPRLIVLSTDDAEIARVAREWGIDVPYMRPAELAADTSGTREVLLHAMDWADSQGLHYDCVLLLQPTSPLRTAEDVRQAIDMYSPDIDMVVSVMESAANPYYDCFETGTDGFLHISKGDGTLTRRQDAPHAWQYNGAVYVINPESLRRMPMGAFPRRLPLVMKRENSIDLDTPLDWTIAEAIMNSRK